LDICEYGGSLIRDSSTEDHLEKLLDDVLVLIKKHLFTDAKLEYLTQELFLDLKYPLPQKKISTRQQRILILDKDDMVNNNLSDIYEIDRIKGKFFYPHGKIYLVKGAWCIETLIHEALHGCSVIGSFSFGEFERYRELNEGLTEFFTGYLLYKEYNDTYENCWKSSDRLCYMTYSATTRFWSTLCQFIPIRDIIPVFFPNNKGVSWESSFELFISKINDHNGTKIRNPITVKGQNPFHEIIKKDCSDRIEKFKSIYKSRKCLEFDRIITNRSD
jgi:hypothetical protein